MVTGRACPRLCERVAGATVEAFATRGAILLTLTTHARDILRKVPFQPAFGPGAGLRIARSQSKEGVFLTALASAPSQDDDVVDDDGARVFLGPVAARRFDGGSLDARTDDRGRIEFVVRTPA